MALTGDTNKITLWNTRSIECPRGCDLSSCDVFSIFTYFLDYKTVTIFANDGCRTKELTVLPSNHQENAIQQVITNNKIP